MKIRILFIVMLLATAPSFAGEKSLCMDWLTRSPLAISADLDLRNKILTIYQQLRSVDTIEKRIGLRIPLYANDMLRIADALQATFDEITAIQHVADRFPYEDDYKYFSSEDFQIFSKFNALKVLKQIHRKILMASKRGPTYTDVLYAARILTDVNSEILRLRDAVYEFDRDQIYESGPLTEQILLQHFSSRQGRKNHARPVSVLSSIFSSVMADRKLNPNFSATEQALANIETSKLVYAKHIFKQKSRIIPIIVVRDDLVPLDVMSDVSISNLTIVQAQLSPIKTDVHGSESYPGNELGVLGHDIFHLRTTRADDEAKAYIVVNELRQRVENDHPEWIPLFKFLIYFQRHEAERKVSDLPKGITRYMLPKDNDLEYHLTGIVATELPQETQELFESDWNNFIKYLSKLPPIE